MKIERILCPIDFSDSDAAINQLASLLAESTGAHITYLHVTQPEVPFMTYEYMDVDKEIGKALERLQKIEPTVVRLAFKHHVEFGSPAKEILEYADDAEIDLIVMGTRGRSGLNRMLMGSVAETVIRNSECPVLAIKIKSAPHVTENDSPSQQLKTSSDLNVACAIDVNDFDQEVVEFAAELAKNANVQLDLIHITILPDSDSPLKHGYFGSPHTLISENRRLHKVRTNVPEVQLNYIHLSGVPAEQILVYADRNKPQVLVLGTHGRRGLARVFGSVATSVLRQAKCPIMILREGQHNEESENENTSVGSTQQSIETAVGPITGCLSSGLPSIETEAKLER